jgi:hypothetical protein
VLPTGDDVQLIFQQIAAPKPQDERPPNEPGD